MIRIVHGIVRGKMIELASALDVAEGQEVEVQVKVIAQREPHGHGILRTAGALADDVEWDAIMKEVHGARKLDRRTVAEP